MTMKIFLPTRGRTRSSTADALRAAGVPFTFVLTEGDAQYPGGPSGGPDLAAGPLEAVTVKAPHIGAKRQAILEMAGDSKFAMMDDDLIFYRRLNDERFVRALPADVKFMVGMLETALNYAPAAGIIPKFMSQQTPRGLRRHGRMDQVLCYNPALFKDPKPVFRAPVAEEHDFNLQILKTGLVPIVFTEFAKGDKPYSSGGCSAWRTPEVELAGLEQVAVAHGLGLYPTKNAISGYRLRVPWAKLTPKADGPDFDTMVDETIDRDLKQWTFRG